jgi:hypothetical protein
MVTLSQAGDPGFGFAETGDTVGAPLFAHFAKGGNHEGMRDGVYAEPKTVLSAASLPTLAKDARMGHPVISDSFRG